ncbi:hypothetical protein BH23ACT12_BH23ACT12_02760 [soil metagenome]
MADLEAISRMLTRAYNFNKMSKILPEPTPDELPEPSVEELLRRARPLPPYEEVVIDDLTQEEGDAFLAAVLS